MTPRDKALRAQDIQTGLQGLSEIPSTVEGEIDQTILAGMAARLATHIRGADIFAKDDIAKLKYVAHSLGIQSALLPRVLNFLQEAELVKVKNSSGGAIAEVTESVPGYGDLYEYVGDVYDRKDTTEIERALLETFDSVVEAPIVGNMGLPILELDKRYKDPLLDVTGQAELIKVRYSKRLKQDIIYSPHYWECNIEKLDSIIQRHGDQRIHAAVQKVQAYQGFPIPQQISTTEDQVLLQLAHAGMLPSPSVKGVNGEVMFAFTPFQSLGNDKAIDIKILEKTRAILSCVRYGEHCANISAIRFPRILLLKLKEKGFFGPHSEIYSQYRTLINHGVCRISRSQGHSDRFYLHFIDRPENHIALDAAINLLDIGIPLAATHVDQEVKKYAVNGEYNEPPTVRAKRKYEPSLAALKALELDVIDMLVTQ